MDTMTDNELVARYLEGDGAALRELFGRYATQAYRFAARYVGPGGDAEDIVQDAFVSAWKNLKRFDREKKFSTWLFTITKNAALNWIKKKKPALFSDFETADGENTFFETLRDVAPRPDERYVEREQAERLASAVGKLSPAYQSVLALHSNDGLTFREISESLKVPLHTVKSRYRRALIALRKLLAD